MGGGEAGAKADRESRSYRLQTRPLMLATAGPTARRTAAHIGEGGGRGKAFVRKWYLRPGSGGHWSSWATAVQLHCNKISNRVARINSRSERATMLNGRAINWKMD